VAGDAWADATKLEGIYGPLGNLTLIRTWIPRLQEKFEHCPLSHAAKALGITDSADAFCKTNIRHGLSTRWQGNLAFKDSHQKQDDGAVWTRRPRR
jgi:hypothetical protein